MKLLLPALLLIPSVGICSSLLTQTARNVLAQSNGRANAEVFLRQAIAEDGQDPEPLTLLAVLRSADLKDSPDELKSEVGPLLVRLLALREQNAFTKPSDLAIALELNARFLDQIDQGLEAQPLHTRALLIRKQLVRELQVEKKARTADSAVLRVGRDVTPPSVLTKEDPGYSEDARLSKISGTVLIETVIDRDGEPTQIMLVRSLGFGLDEKAAQAVAAWRFQPGVKNGQPVPVRATIEVNFRLL